MKRLKYSMIIFSLAILVWASERFFKNTCYNRLLYHQVINETKGFHKLENPVYRTMVYNSKKRGFGLYWGFEDGDEN